MNLLARLRYSRTALKRDYWRAGLGLAMCGIMFALVTPGGIAFWIASACSFVFLAFGLSTIKKHLTIIDIDESGLDIWLAWTGGTFIRHRRVDLDKLDGLRLRYFGRRRDKGRGIVEMTLRSGRTHVTVDHALDGFESLVGRAFSAACSRNLVLDTATSANLAALGYK